MECSRKVLAMSEMQRPHARDLISAARARSALSRRSAEALSEGKVVQLIESGLDRSQTVSKPGRITLVTLEPDDSISIFMDDAGVQRDWTRQAEAIMTGHNELLQGMQTGPEGRRSMLLTRYLNGTVLNPFMPLALCRQMDRRVYRADPGGTPLYAETLATLGIVLAKTEELTNRGARVRTATLVMTDGEATDFTSEGERKLRSIVQDMRESGVHTIVGMGLGRHANFTQTFTSMGIDERHVYTAANIESILEAFRMFGKEVLLLAAGTSSEPGRRIFTG